MVGAKALMLGVLLLLGGVNFLLLRNTLERPGDAAAAASD